MFSALATLLGVTLIVLALRDVFHQLFHPSGAGNISGALMKAVWRTFCLLARRYPSLLALAGPSALVAIIAKTKSRKEAQRISPRFSRFGRSGPRSRARPCLSTQRRTCP